MGDSYSSKDLYAELWRCRDFEISHFWQRSIFLTAFHTMCFVGYGALLTSCLADQRPWWVLCALMFLCEIGAMSSVLWICMAKGSKAWYEIYEQAISAFSRGEKGVLNRQEEVKNCCGFRHNEIPGYVDGERDKKIISLKAGSFSPSKINIAIGVISLGIWIFLLLAQCVVLVRQGDLWLGIFAALCVLGAPVLCVLFGENGCLIPIVSSTLDTADDERGRKKWKAYLSWACVPVALAGLVFAASALYIGEEERRASSESWREKVLRIADLKLNETSSQVVKREFRCLVSALVEVETEHNDCANVLTRAVKIGDLEIVRIISNPAAHLNINALDRDGQSALGLACALKRVEIVHILIEAGADVDVRDAEGKTPLINATITGCKPIIGSLIAAGANPLIKDKEGRMPGDFALANGDTDTIALFAKSIRSHKGEE